MNENHSSGSERYQLDFELGAKDYFFSSIINSIKKDLIKNPQKYAVWFFEAFKIFLNFYNNK